MIMCLIVCLLYRAVSEVILRGQLFKKGSLYVKVFKIYQVSITQEQHYCTAICCYYDRISQCNYPFMVCSLVRHLFTISSS